MNKDEIKKLTHKLYEVVDYLEEEMVRVSTKSNNKNKLSNLENTLISALKLAYRKHWLNDDSIGWNELGDKIHNALCEGIGDKEFVEWKNEYKRNK